jgi:hypothetical protein
VEQGNGASGNPTPAYPGTAGTVIQVEVEVEEVRTNQDLTQEQAVQVSLS